MGMSVDDGNNGRGEINAKKNAYKGQHGLILKYGSLFVSMLVSHGFDRKFFIIFNTKKINWKYGSL